MDNLWETVPLNIYKNLIINLIWFRNITVIKGKTCHCVIQSIFVELYVSYFSFTVLLTKQTRSHMFKIVSNLCFSQNNTVFIMCVCACGWASIFLLGLYVSLWRFFCPSRNPDDGQKSPLKPVRVKRQQLYIKNCWWESWQTTVLNLIVIHLWD